MGFFDFFKKRQPDARELFLVEVQQRVQSLEFVDRVTRHASEYALEVTFDDDRRAEVFLENLFAEIHEGTHEHREAVIQRFVSILGTSQEGEQVDWPTAAKHLLPVLRGALPSWPSLAGGEVLPCLNQHLVVDRSNGFMTLVTREQLLGWGVGFDEALVVARENLRRRAQEGIELLDAALGLYEVSSGDSHQSSRLLLPGFLQGFASRVQGQPIAAVPSRDQLFIGGDANAAAVTRLCELAAREFPASPRRISAALYTVDAVGQLVPYRRTTDDAAAREVRSNEVGFVGTEYAEQRQELERRFEASGTDIFVASFGSITEENGAQSSWCSWGYGIDSLLPVTDVVVLSADDTSAPLRVPWAEVLRIAGDCLKRDEALFPSRYRTIGVPNASQRAALAEAAVKPSRGTT